MFLLTQFHASTAKKVSLAKTNSLYAFVGYSTQRQDGAGRKKKWNDLETFIVETVQRSWECGAPMTPEQLQHTVMQHVKNEKNTRVIDQFVNGKRNTFSKFIQRVLKMNNFSVRKMAISQSVPVDWHQKAEDNTSRIREKFKAEKVDVVVNADESFLLFHPFGECLVAPTGVKHVGTAVQVDNEKWGATVMIACKYKTSCILLPMIIFTGVYGAKLMTHWAAFERAKVIFNESHWMTSNAAIIYISYLISMFPGK
jgi:hypothetical protein